MYVVNGSDGRCLVAVRLIVGVRYLERPLREVLLYIVLFSLHLYFVSPLFRMHDRYVSIIITIAIYY